MDWTMFAYGAVSMGVVCFFLLLLGMYLNEKARKREFIEVMKQELGNLPKRMTDDEVNDLEAELAGDEELYAPIVDDKGELESSPAYTPVSRLFGDDTVSHR